MQTTSTYILDLLKHNSGIHATVMFFLEITYGSTRCPIDSCVYIWSKGDAGFQAMNNFMVNHQTHKTVTLHENLCLP